MYRNGGKEYSCGSLREEEINPESKDVQNKILKQQGSSGPLQKLQDSDNKEDDKANELDLKGKNSDERKVDQSIGPLSLSKNAGTIQPNIDTSKLHKKELTFKNRKQLKPSNVILLLLLLMLTINSSCTKVYANANEIRRTETMIHTNANE